MKIIFGSFRNAARDEKLIDSTIGRRGAPMKHSSY
jgi:hypothetical protein